MKLQLFITVLLLQLFSVMSVQAQTIHLSVAASMTDVFKELITKFTANNTEVEFLPNFASSGSLAKQIDQGAPADIFVSANPKWMQYLVEKQLVSKATDRIFAFNQLVFVGEKKSVDLSLQKLVNLERIALGSPKVFLPANTPNRLWSMPEYTPNLNRQRNWLWQKMSARL